MSAAVPSRHIASRAGMGGKATGFSRSNDRSPGMVRSAVAAIEEVDSTRLRSETLEQTRKEWLQALPPLPASPEDSQGLSVWKRLRGCATVAACSSQVDSPHAPSLHWFIDQCTRLRNQCEALAHIAAVSRSLVNDTHVPVRAVLGLADLVVSPVIATAGAGGTNPNRGAPVLDIDTAEVARELLGPGPWDEHLAALDAALVFHTTLERDGRWSNDLRPVVVATMLQNAGREVLWSQLGRTRTDHAAVGAALLSARAEYPPLVSTLIAHHHAFPIPNYSQTGRGGLRIPLLARGAAAVTRLVELERMLGQLPRAGTIIRETAFQQLLRETEGARSDRYWIDVLVKMLDGTAARESLAGRFPNFKGLPETPGVGEDATGRLDGAEPGPRRPHDIRRQRPRPSTDTPSGRG